MNKVYNHHQTTEGQSVNKFATSSTSQDLPRQSSSLVNCTSVAYPELVSTSATVVNSSANLVASSGQSLESPSQPRTAPAETQDVIRKTLSNKGFSKQAIDIIYASWTAGTEKQYRGVWSSWCHKRQIDLLQASVIQVVEFLTDCYHGGKEILLVHIL